MMTPAVPRCGLVLLLLVGAAWCPAASAAEMVPEKDYWLSGRASWYGGQNEHFVDPFVASRGGGRSAFGVLSWGGCGYTNGDGTVLVPREAASSYADQNPDAPGSCGRCYEVRCAGGPVLGWENKPVDFRTAYYPFWWYANVTGNQGRKFPGNRGAAQNVLDVQCWSKTKSVVVKIIDVCPCWYEPRGQKPYYQYDCCYKSQKHPKAGQLNLDLSFWAFQDLAHPEYGVMPVQFRPVDCESKKPIRFEPGYISDVIFEDFPGVGWSWFATNFQPTNKFSVVDKGQGINGGAASCAQLKYNGGMSWSCRGCGMKAGYQPFAGASSVTFSIKDQGKKGSVPPVTLALTNAEHNTGCSNKLDLASRTPDSKGSGDGWLKFTVPISAFGCGHQEQMNQLMWEAKPGTSSGFAMCLDDVRINRPQGGGGSMQPRPAVTG